MNKLLKVFGLSIILTASCYSVYAQDNAIITEQQQMLSVLTGESQIAEHKIIKSRYTEAERALTRTFLKGLLKDLSLDTKEHAYKLEFPNDTFEGANVYALLPSTIKSDDFIVLGAHFDSVKGCPGANDNASGIVLIYSVVKQLQQLSYRNKNVILVFFDQEEQGLIGSKAFADYIKETYDSIHSVHTIDQMGWDNDNDRAIELEIPTQELEKAYRIQADKLKIPIHISTVDATDHKSFRTLGYNAIGITEEYVNKDTTPYYHKSSDTFDTLNFEYLASSTNLVFEVFKTLLTER